jgi:hypothetical protein
MEIEESKVVTLPVEESSEKTKVIKISSEVKEILKKMYPMRNTFAFGGKGGVVVSSDFDGGNLALCQ